MIMGVAMATAIATDALLRLQSWLSPAFPIGAYSYSHGLETAIEQGLVTDRESLTDWLDGVLRFGAGRNDAILLAEAWHAAVSGDRVRLAEVASLAAALPGAAELQLETMQQGGAFAATLRAAWPEQAAALDQVPGTPPLPVAVAVAAAAETAPLDAVLPMYLQAFAANLVSAAVRAVPLGQSDGQRTIAALEPTVQQVALEAAGTPLDDIGGAALMSDWCAMAHETQDGRLFRS